MVEPTGVIGLIGLFTTCLEGYRICLSMGESDTDMKILQTLVLVEQQRFLTFGKTCGLLRDSQRKEQDVLREFLEEDPFRKHVIGETLELIAMLLGRAEDLGRKYSIPDGLPEVFKDRTVVASSMADKFQQWRVSLKKIPWAIRDKPAYEELIKHLQGFNTALETILPGPLQQFLKTVVPATICATSDETGLSSLQQASRNSAFLRSQLEWSSQIHGLSGVQRGRRLVAKSITPTDEREKNSNRYLASDSMRRSLLVEWLPWYANSDDMDERSDRVARVSGLLQEVKSKELRILPVCGYMEQDDLTTGKTRLGLVYDFDDNKKSKTLSELLEVKKVLFPPLEARVMLARTLCRAMLLYHASGWIHHDFRSHNILFAEAKKSLKEQPFTMTSFQGVNLTAPFVVGFGYARDETQTSLMFTDKKAAGKSLSQQKKYWSSGYLASSKEMRTKQPFQREHDVYSLGCVMLEIGVWKSLDSYTWESSYEKDHGAWCRRLLREEDKLRALCGSRYAEAVMTCLKCPGLGRSAAGDVQALAFDILLKLEEIVT